MKKVLNTTDLDLNFMANPFTGDVSVKTGIDAIKQSLKNILFRSSSEKPFSDEIYNTNIRSYLFEQNDIILENELGRFIRININKYEPRVEITDILIQPADVDLNITITFSVIDNPDIQQILNLKVEKTR